MFEIGAKIDAGWSSDNKQKKKSKSSEDALPPEKHTLKIRLEKRRGKWVTLCSPFRLPREEKSRLLSSLKKELGCGGTFKEETLELQGKRSEELRQALKQRGFSKTN
ncbi:translation initiation factor [Nitratifractor salsuginis]|uniref:Translation initiation factor SUI1 n=1 Tax=Nitratifractor salsuginis (strain DSM 16511 / JCM 12458 / E9I37-1) TaxID=749222 RepID=E6X2T4_NITSE|nr:translation initiation factor [Nitratifractor salsuginis]ADV47217.1 translation initiation factor SUI1 [Nitratifractor salsuginis DSM 16511]